MKTRNKFACLLAIAGVSLSGTAFAQSADFESVRCDDGMQSFAAASAGLPLEWFATGSALLVDVIDGDVLDDENVFVLADENEPSRSAPSIRVNKRTGRVFMDFGIGFRSPVVPFCSVAEGPTDTQFRIAGGFLGVGNLTITLLSSREQAEPGACGGLLGLSCEGGEFCNFSIEASCGAADATGTCESIPEICTQEFDPVCGCDGNTYSNSCAANGAGVSVASRGACEGETSSELPAQSADFESVRCEDGMQSFAAASAGLPLEWFATGSALLVDVIDGDVLDDENVFVLADENEPSRSAPSIRVLKRTGRAFMDFGIGFRSPVVPFCSVAEGPTDNQFRITGGFLGVGNLTITLLSSEN